MRIAMWHKIRWHRHTTRSLWIWKTKRGRISHYTKIVRHFTSIILDNKFTFSFSGSTLTDFFGEISNFFPFIHSTTMLANVLSSADPNNFMARLPMSLESSNFLQWVYAFEKNSASLCPNSVATVTNASIAANKTWDGVRLGLEVRFLIELNSLLPASLQTCWKTNSSYLPSLTSKFLSSVLFPTK